MADLHVMHPLEGTRAWNGHPQQEKSPYACGSEEKTADGVFEPGLAPQNQAQATCQTCLALDLSTLK